MKPRHLVAFLFTIAFAIVACQHAISPNAPIFDASDAGSKVGSFNAFTPPTGTGIAHIVGGQLVSPASLIVNVDVDVDAGIDLTKLAGCANDGGIPRFVAGTWLCSTDNVGDAGVTIGGTCTLEQFGAVGDGVTSDQTPFNNAISALGSTCGTLVLGAKTYLVTGSSIAHDNIAIIGQGATSVLKTTTNAPVISSSGHENLTFAHFKILGNATGGLQDGIKLGVSGSSGTGPERARFLDVTVESVGNAGFEYAENPILVHSGPVFDGCRVSGSSYGFRIGARGEYVRIVGSEAVSNAYGLYTSAGNTVASGDNFSTNAYGVYVDNGTNDSHGVVSGSNINHNTAANVYVGGIANGFNFDGDHLFAGAIQLNGADGVVFSNCEIDATEYDFTSAQGNVFTDCLFPAASTNTIVESGSWTYWINARKFDNSVPSWAATRQQIDFTFGSDSDTFLSKQQGLADVIRVQAGTITATRKLTYQWNPSVGEHRLIQNLNAHDVQICWNSGTCATVTAGQSAIIGSDGTNAVSLLQTSAGGGGGPTVPTGTGFWHITAGSSDAASKKVDTTSSADVTVCGTSNGIVRSAASALTCDSGFTYDGSGNATLSGSLTIGSTAASTGLMRVPYSGATRTVMAVRDSANSTDRVVIKTSGESEVFGDTSTDNFLQAHSWLMTTSANGIDLEPAGTYGLYLTNTTDEHGHPIIGDSRASSPYAAHGAISVTFPTGTTTLAASQYKYAAIILTVTATHGDATAVLPAPTDSAGSDAYWKIINNQNSAGNAIMQMASTSGTVTIGALKTSIVFVHRGLGVIRVTPDT